MDPQIKSIIEKRKSLGWKVWELAEKAGVSSLLLKEVERENQALKKVLGDWGGLISKLNSILDKAIKSNLKQHKKIFPKNSVGPYDWSQKHAACRECGTNKIKHKGRGLCIKCYDRENEKRQKSHSRERGIAGKKLTREYLLEEYWVKEKSLNDIAKDCACTRQYVYKKLNQYQFPIRNKKSARSIALERGKLDFKIVDEEGVINLIKLQKVNVNEDFFSSWSKEMAWVLGLIYSDGCLQKDQPRFHIDQKELSLLEKVKNLMNCNAKLFHKPKKIYKNVVSGECYRLHIFNQKIYDDLIKFGLTPDKSMTINFPDVPSQYIRHFIRGCWDGDGSVYIEKGFKRITASYVSGSTSFIPESCTKLAIDANAV